MKMKKSYHFTISLIVCLALILAACSKSNNVGSSTSPESQNPQMTATTTEKTPSSSGEVVTIRVADPYGEGNFNTSFKTLESQLKNIKLEFIPFDSTSKRLQEMFANKIVPDIIIADPPYGLQPLEELELVYPLDDMVKEKNFDLKALNPSVVAYARSLDAKQRLIGMPNGTGYFGLFYNKEIFDLFGVPYPSEDLTWDQALELAKKLTGEKNGVAYTGLEFGSGSTGSEAQSPLMEMAVNMTDPVTGEVLLTKDPAFAKYLELMKRFYSIPGIRSEAAKAGSMFEKSQAAMIIHWYGFLGWDWGNEEIKKKMDLVPVPTWADNPGVGPYLDTAPMVINSFSEHKDEAFQVLAAYLGKQNQIEIAKNVSSGIVLEDQEIKEQYGANVPAFKDKNVAAFFKLKPAEPKTIHSPWDQYVSFDLAKFADSDMNIQEFLRTTKEEAEAKIADAKTKK